MINSQNNILFSIILFSWLIISACSNDETQMDSSTSTTSTSTGTIPTHIAPELQTLFELVNTARNAGGYCDGAYFDPAEPYSYDDTLAQAAQIHSEDMAARDFFAHENPEGESVEDRVAALGYSFLRVGENVAGGSNSAQIMFDGWMASTGHCSNIRSPEFSMVGFGKAYNENSAYGYYWTQVFARPGQ